ncbi:MAG: flavodoxin domain-containing protein [Candidatus Bathyarchaeota archaeon]|nr:flavodoxin domain-containing protein [Candidatus Bathyarchaeota archaeon]MCX8177024.1 flavodoxin domain-containing protein [Candidatus Bathyarchaeota archaeon]MDW8194237.1 flavodoxin domain-containing protein [Nitrososphaerota archaeon]
MVNVLIVYGTRYGAAESTAKDIADVLQDDGFHVKAVDAKAEKLGDIADYQLIIVGSGIQNHKWTEESEKFLKRFSEKLREKKLALFVCCGDAHPLTEKEEEKTKIVQEARRKYLEEKAAKYGLNPVAMGLFGGIYNFNKMPWWSRKFMQPLKKQLEAEGFKEAKSGIYDTRDLQAIRNWTKELVRK